MAPLKPRAMIEIKGRTWPCPNANSDTRLTQIKVGAARFP